MDKRLAMSILVLGCSAHAPECDAPLGPSYPCSDIARQAKIAGLDEAFAVTGRDDLPQLHALAEQAATQLRQASSDADRAEACAWADYVIAKMICEYDGSGRPDWEELVADWRHERGML